MIVGILALQGAFIEHKNILDKLNKNFYILFSLIISAFINLLTEIFNQGFNDVGKFFKNLNPNDEFIENFPTWQYYLIYFFFYLKLIFSDLSYIVLNLIIDLKLLSFIKKQNTNRARIVNNVVNNNINNTTKNQGNDRLNLTKNRLTLMIFLNELNCFIIRFPMAFANLYGFINRYDKTI